MMGSNWICQVGETVGSLISFNDPGCDMCPEISCLVSEGFLLKVLNLITLLRSKRLSSQKSQTMLHQENSASVLIRLPPINMFNDDDDDDDDEDDDVDDYYY